MTDELTNLFQPMVATSDLDVAVQAYEAGAHDPAEIADALAARYGEGSTHHASFLNHWQADEAADYEPPPLTAEEYRANLEAGKAAQRALMIDTLANKERQEAEQAAAAKLEMISGEFERFAETNPRALDPSAVATFRSVLPDTEVPDTAEEVRMLLRSTLNGHHLIDGAMRKAQTEFEHWHVADWDAATAAREADWMGVPSLTDINGQRVEKPTLQQLQEKHLTAALNRTRLDGTPVVQPRNLAESITDTVAWWDEKQAPFEQFDKDMARVWANATTRSGETNAQRHERLTGQKVTIEPADDAASGRGRASFFDDGSHDRAREEVLDGGWNV
jgi:hypothetical protein